MFHVGQKVVCVVDPDQWICHQGEAPPKRDRVYTIRATNQEDGETYLQFIELANAPRVYADAICECFWWSCGFRPIVERKTDISMFTELLTPSRPRVLEQI